MKKILLFLMMLTLSAVNSAQSYTRSGNTFISSTGELKKQEPVKTKFTWKDSKGKEYKSYLGAEISQQICKELGVEYKNKKK